MKCGQNRDTNAGFRIVGGKEACKNDAPWQISITVNVKIRVVAGSLVRKKGYKVGQYLDVQKMYLHPTWNEKTSAGDIALMKLKGNFKYTTTGNGPDGTG
ncbi:hypothetical protein B4U80_14813, partial [Leptotrombidium deliense]